MDQIRTPHVVFDILVEVKSHCGNFRVLELLNLRLVQSWRQVGKSLREEVVYVRGLPGMSIPLLTSSMASRYRICSKSLVKIH